MRSVWVGCCLVLVVLAASCNSREKQLAGVWTSTESGEGWTAQHERTFLPNGVYIDRVTFGGVGSQADTIHSGRWWYEGDTLHWREIDGFTTTLPPQTATKVASDDSTLTLTVDQKKEVWSRARALEADHDPNRTTTAALEKAKRAIDELGHCLVGGQLPKDASTRLQHFALDRALAAHKELDDKGNDVWPGSCAQSVKDAYTNLSSLETPEALERCTRARKGLEILSHSLDTLGSYRSSLTPEAIQDLTDCGLIDETAAPSPSPTSASPPLLGLGWTLPHGSETHHDFAFAPTSANAARFLVGAATEALFCTSTGGEMADGLLCEPVQGTVKPHSTTVLPATTPSAPLWYLDRSDPKTALRSIDKTVTLMGSYPELYVDKAGVHGFGQGSILSGTLDHIEETPSTFTAGAGRLHGDLLITEGRPSTVRRVRGDELSEPVELQGIGLIRKSYGCYAEGPGDNPRFNVIGFGGGSVWAVLTGDDGALTPVSVAAEVDTANLQEPKIACSRDRVSVTWLDAANPGGAERRGGGLSPPANRVARVACTLTGCSVERSEPIQLDKASRPIVLNVGRSILLVQQLRSNFRAEAPERIVYRLAPIEALHETNDAFLYAATPDSGSSALPQVEAVALGQSALVLLVVNHELHGLRVGSDGALLELQVSHH
ncbi:MAG: hypothetical protein U0271_36950 [Polyangiaceae bacterium]